MKTLATVKTYNPNDCTETGYDIQVRDNGTLRITSRTCWQGGRDGVVWIAAAPAAVMMAARGEAGDEEPDVETAIADYLLSDPSGWKRIRLGYVIR